MIQEISISNYKSFRDRTTLSFELVEEDDFKKDTLSVKVADNVHLSRFCVLYGANGSGKSNLLGVFDLVHELFYDELRIKDYKFAFDDKKKDEPTDIEIVSWIEDKEGKYRKCEYSVSLHEDNIQKEILNVDGVQMFERTQEDNFANIKISEQSGLNPEQIGYVKYSCKPFQSVINILCNINIQNRLELPLIDIAIKIMMQFRLGKAVSISDNILKDPDEKYVCEVFKELDYDVTGIQRTESGNYLLSHAIDGKEGNYKLLDKDESAGTISFINLLTDAKEYIKNTDKRIQSLYRIDEPDNSLHDYWFRYFISLFLNGEDKHNQLLITTHNTLLLDWVNRDIRADSVWFVAKDKELKSEIYSLADFKNLDEVLLYSKEYLNGNFGAIPEIEF